MSKLIDITGMKFGDWVVLYQDKRNINKDSKTKWMCECDCGNIKSVYGYYLRKGKSLNCGCKRNIKSEVGNKYNKLTVVKRDTSKPKGKGAYWICQCECGNLTSVKTGDLRDGDIRSCGCLSSPELISRQENTYIEKESYILGIASNGGTFLIDKEYYDVVKKFYWCVDYEGYIVTSYDSKTL